MKRMHKSATMTKLVQAGIKVENEKLAKSDLKRAIQVLAAEEKYGKILWDSQEMDYDSISKEYLEPLAKLARKHKLAFLGYDLDGNALLLLPCAKAKASHVFDEAEGAWLSTEDDDGADFFKVEPKHDYTEDFFLTRGLKFQNLDLSDASLKSLPKGLLIEEYLDLSGCKSLESLPSGLKVGGNLYLRGCDSLKSLPSGLEVNGDLDLYNCRSLESLPSIRVGGNLNLEGCTSLISLPPDLKVGGDLSLTGCTSLKSLPPDLKVGGDLYLYGCNSLDIQSFKELRKNKGVKGTIRGVTEILKAKA